jgi:flagellar motor switch protein FliG
LSDMVHFEDLAQLDGGDLKAVFGQVDDHDILDALAGTTLHMRRQFLTKLPAASAAKLEAEIVEHGPVGSLTVQAAQRNLVEALCRLSRGGQVAFDDPADMMVA